MSGVQAILGSDGVVLQPNDVRGMRADDLRNLIVSEIKVDDQWVVLSRYIDPTWFLNGGATNKIESDHTLNFLSVPEVFRDTLKAAAYRYWRRGLESGKRPSVATMHSFICYSRPFLRYLADMRVTSLAGVTPMLCSAYVAASRTPDPANPKDDAPKLAKITLEKRFSAVEKLYELSHFTSDRMPSQPWPDSSARQLAGLKSSPSGRARETKTPLIPNEVFVPLFQRAWKIVEGANELLDIRDAIGEFDMANEQLPHSTHWRRRQGELSKLGWVRDGQTLQEALNELRAACYVVIASVSGCRNHEMANLRVGSYRSTCDDEGNTYWWMRSHSSKTDVGSTEWMIPEAGVKALTAMERWARPYQAKLDQEIAALRKESPKNPKIATASKHSGALFLGVDYAKGNRVRTLSGGAWNRTLKAFAQASGLSWDLGSHQFRRKFANYAARSQFGDLRYLRDHFKHWSMDMTLGYALNESQEMALYLEIQDELDDIKFEVAEEWLTEGTRLAGGYGKNIVDWRERAEPVTLFKGHKEMVKAIAQSTAIRSNGHAWCTADDNLCPGNDLDLTRCGDGCQKAVVAPRHAPIYQRMYSDLSELADRDDIGEPGRLRVQRDMSICAATLNDLGYDAKSQQALDGIEL